MKLTTILKQSLNLRLLGCALSFSGCASIINGSTQKVKISSQPSGAAIRIDGTGSGVTPSVAELSRKGSHRVELTLNGFRPYEIVLEPKFNGATLGNMAVGGIIGLAIDGSTGAGNTLHPEKVEAVLIKK